ncbi:hypothetical protein Xoosp13_366 [Xanthomonas phage Xoo-sp13]|nr:hypothetical protein Xoosp13_366 [Xanthomonas phage Xoo-sp13]
MSSYDNNTGVLLIPSLQDQTRFITITDLSRDEAAAFIKEFTARVKAERKIKNTPAKNQTVDDFIEYNLVEGLDSFLIDDVFDLLKTSTVVGARGNRAVFLDEDSDTILVGSTVVYNKNWAMVGFVDDTIVDTLLNIEDRI